MKTHAVNVVCMLVCKFADVYMARLNPDGFNQGGNRGTKRIFIENRQNLNERILNHSLDSLITFGP